jgi:hypothetical protein
MNMMAGDGNANLRGWHTYNIGTGKSISELEIIKEYEKASGLKIEFKILGRRVEDAPSIVTFTEKAKEELDWRAEKTIKDICKDSWLFTSLMQTQANFKTNWAKNVTYSAKKLVEPKNLMDLKRIIKKAAYDKYKVRVLGSGYSFNDIADTTGIHISMRHFNAISIDKIGSKSSSNRAHCWVDAGVSFTQLCRFLK